VEPEDERPHQPGADPRWAEWWYFDFAVADVPAAAAGGQERLAGCVRLCLMPYQGVARYWASLVGSGRQPVVVHDDEVPLPRRGSMEVRAEGLWADHVIEAPFEQVGVGCEAFGLRLGSLADLECKPVVGERVPFGLDLEWATLPGVSPLAVGIGSDTPAGEPTVAGDGSQPRSPARAPQGYRIDCEVLGEVLVSDERIQIEAPGSRRHAWGAEPPQFVPWFEVPTIAHHPPVQKFV
jgi:hypothetical protein